MLHLKNVNTEKLCFNNLELIFRNKGVGILFLLMIILDFILLKQAIEALMSE